MNPVDGIDRPVGFWRALVALGDERLKRALWPEFVLALLIGGAGSILIVRSTRLTERLALTGDLLALAGAFLAVVFTALALVASISSRSYLLMLAETRDGGIHRFLNPFLIGVGVQVATILLTVGYKVGAAHVSPTLEHVTFYVIGFLFAFGTLDICALARILVRHGVLRAADAALTAQEDARQRLRSVSSQR